MRIPTKLKIGGHQFKVLITDTRPGLMGEMDTSKNTIKIDKTLPQTQKEVTLMHEIFHAINTELDNSANGHALLESLSQQLYQVFVDNKMFK